MKYPIFGSNKNAATPSNTAASNLQVWGHHTAAAQTISGIVPAPLTISNLTILVDNPPGGTASWQLVLQKNGATASYSVTVSGSNTIAVNTGSVSYAAGDTIGLRIIPQGTPVRGDGIYWNMIAEASGQAHFGYNNTGTTTGTTYLVPYARPGSGDTSTNSTTQEIVVPTAGTISNLYLSLTAAPGVGNSKTLRFIKNGVNSNPLTTVSDTATVGNNSVDTLSIAAGDRITLQVTATGTPASSAHRWGYLFTPTVDGKSYIGFAGDNTLGSGTSTIYSGPVLPQPQPGTTDNQPGIIGGDWLISELWGKRVGSTTWNTTLRKNSTNSDLSIPLGNAVNSDTGSLYLVQGDKLSTMFVPGSNTTTRFNLGMLVEEGTAPPVTSNTTDFFNFF